MVDEYYQPPQAMGGPIDGKGDSADRRGRLKLMGIIQIVLGALVAVAIPFMVLGILLQRHLPTELGVPPSPVGPAIASIVLYTLVAVAFLFVGVGSLRARRWVRPIVLSIAWPSLVMGIVAFGLSLWLVPRTMRAAFASKAALPAGADGAAVAEAAMEIATGFTLGFLFVIYILIPVLHLLAYQSRSVKRTCERLDPNPRWTDRCPLPVLGLALWLGLCALMLLSLVAVQVFLFFGFILEGPLAAVIGLGFALTAAWLAWQAYRQRPLGWWGSAGFFTALFGSTVLTFALRDFSAIYAETGLIPAKQLEALAPMLTPLSTICMTGGAVSWLCLVGFLLAISKHFRASKTAR